MRGFLLPGDFSGERLAGAHCSVGSFMDYLLRFFSICLGIFLSQFVISDDMFLIPIQTGLRIQR